MTTTTQLWTNNAAGWLASPITAGATSITLATGQGARFPDPASATGGYFDLTLFQRSGITESNHEIVRVTARSGDVLSGITRGMEGTTARAFNAMDPVELRGTAGALSRFRDTTVPTETPVDLSGTFSAGATTVAVPGGYDVGRLAVYLNGGRLTDTTDFTATDGTNIVFGTGLAVDDTLVAVKKGSVASSDLVSLSGALGATLVGNGGETVADSLNALQLADYAALRTYAGPRKSVYVTGYLVSAAPSGVAGMFVRDDSDTTTADNGGTVIVASNGKRWKRCYSGDIDVRWFGADSTGTLAASSAIQAAINYAATLSLVGARVRAPAGSYKLDQPIYTYGASGTGQVALIGDGEFATRFLTSGDFTAIHMVSSYVESGGFSVEWPVTAAASIPTTRIGVEFAGANNQVAYALLKNITVQYAYRGFVLNDWTGQTYGSMYLVTLQKLSAFRCADWGFYLNSKIGSTTLRLLQCYVRGDSSDGSGAYGKGVYANNFNDVYGEQVTVDFCLNSWLTLTNYNVCVLNGTAFESNKMNLSSATAIMLQGAHTSINGLKDISNTYDTSGNARVIYAGSTCQLTISGYNEQYSTVVAGTTKYKLAFNASGTDVSVLDRSILSADILDNGWYHSVVYQGVRRSRTGTAPSYGSWVRGDYIKNGAPATGQPKGWYRVTTGSGNTSGTDWISEGNL